MKYIIFTILGLCVLFACTKTASEIRLDMNVEEFKSTMNEPNTVILDVRTPGETADGIIEGAVEMDIKGADFEEKIKSLDKEKKYLVYCRSGGRSVTACNMLEKHGFTKLVNLKGGYTAWSKSEK